jgi:hypothetical protein
MSRRSLGARRLCSSSRLIFRLYLPDNENVRLPNATTGKRLYLLGTRLLAPLCAALALLFFYDLATPATETDTARVVGKVRRSRRGLPVFAVEAKGRYTYREEVSARIFRTIEVGDTLRVSLSPVLTEWKTMEVVRNGSVVATAGGLDLSELSGMAAMGLLLLVGLGAFLPERVLFPDRLFSAHARIAALVIAVPVVDLVAVLLWLRLVQVWMGHIEKV